jgi:hypothetical protein
MYPVPVHISGPGEGFIPVTKANYVLGLHGVEVGDSKGGQSVGKKLPTSAITGEHSAMKIE